MDDPILASLIELAVYSILNDRPLFNNPLEEPAFYRRYFYRWVKEGIDEARNMSTRPDMKNTVPGRWYQGLNPGGRNNEAITNNQRIGATPPAPTL